MNTIESPQADGFDIETRRGLLRLLATKDDIVPTLAVDLDQTEMEIVRMSLQCVALELVKVSAEHEVDTGDKLHALRFVSGLVGGLVGLEQGTGEHPWPESFDIGARERARFLGDAEAASAAQQRIDQCLREHDQDS